MDMVTRELNHPYGAGPQLGIPAAVQFALGAHPLTGCNIISDTGALGRVLVGASNEVDKIERPVAAGPDFLYFVVGAHAT
jgi:hypothetical protein